MENVTNSVCIVEIPGPSTIGDALAVRVMQQSMGSVHHKAPECYFCILILPDYSVVCF